MIACHVVLTSDVWACHGGATDGICGRVAGVPGGRDACAWSEDVDAATIVGEARAIIGAVGGSNGDGLANREERPEEMSGDN